MVVLDVQVDDFVFEFVVQYFVFLGEQVIQLVVVVLCCCFMGDLGVFVDVFVFKVVGKDLLEGWVVGFDCWFQCRVVVDEFVEGFVGLDLGMLDVEVGFGEVEFGVVEGVFEVLCWCDVVVGEVYVVFGGLCVELFQQGLCLYLCVWLDVGDFGVGYCEYLFVLWG